MNEEPPTLEQEPPKLFTVRGQAAAVEPTPEQALSVDSTQELPTATLEQASTAESTAEPATPKQASML